jgi:hypothetical protein
MDVSKSGGRVTDMQNRASVPSLVTAGTALLGTVLASTVLLAAGCASTPAADGTLSETRPGHPPARPAATQS